MWLRRLFGRKADKIDPEDEPARVPTPAAHMRTGPQAQRRTTQSARGAADGATETGFDPYNSGTFRKKNDAWERVVRR